MMILAFAQGMINRKWRTSSPGGSYTNCPVFFSKNDTRGTRMQHTGLEGRGRGATSTRATSERCVRSIGSQKHGIDKRLVITRACMPHR